MATCYFSTCCNDNFGSGMAYAKQSQAGKCYTTNACATSNSHFPACTGGTTCSFCYPDKAVASGTDSTDLFTNSGCTSACSGGPELTGPGVLSKLSPSVLVPMAALGLFLLFRVRDQLKSGIDRVGTGVAAVAEPVFGPLRRFFQPAVQRVGAPFYLGVFAETCVQLILPVAQFLFLRYFISSGLDVKLGFPAGTDYDFVPFCVIAFFLLNSALQKNKATPLAFQKDIFLLNVSLLAFICSLSFFFKTSLSYANRGFMVVWFALVAFTIGSALFVWRRPAFFFTHPKRWLIIPAALVAGSGIISITIFNFIWEPITHLTGILTYRLLAVGMPGLKYNVRYAMRPTLVDEYTTIDHANFGVSLGKGCGGMEGIFLFLWVLGFFIVSNHKRFNWKTWGTLAVSGVFYMYILNVLRLVIFFVAGLNAVQIWGQEKGAIISSVFFHNNLGWVVYGIGLFVFFRIAFRRASSQIGAAKSPVSTPAEVI